ncbi:MAG TPA: NADH-quinone oxidoreductase subunit NuoG [Acidimicrobiia bacterium]|nr:NADH-quinone oxidoreductase subunit NuoG [Acidimicrobiia bacterium]
MVKVTIDGKEVEVPAGELIIKAAQDHGTYIPRFCWHPRMEPVGMCRMCLVEVETPRGKGLVTSCTQRCAEGTIVDTKSDVVKKAQEGVLEFLLINHPLDCPVCDRGGECPLQDQTLSHGPGESRFVEEKRHFEKPIPISDLVMLDRERCILCARCTRFSDEISGDPLIEFLDRGNYTQVNTFPDEPFASYFSGNTVQICPVGALTATPYRFRARPWDLEAVESTCTMCSVGCRVSIQASQNEVLRLLGVDSEPVSHGWLCDKGRFGYEYLRSPGRLATPLVRGEDGELREATWGDALARAGEGLSEIIEKHGPSAVAGIGGARSTNEEAYAFGKLLRSVIGTGNLDARVGDSVDAALLTAGGPHALIGDLEKAKTVLVWGPDLKEELPVLYLRVRRAATALGATLIVVHPRATGLDPEADHVVRYRPGEGGALLERLARGDGDLADVRAALDQGPVVAIVGRAGATEPPQLASAVAVFAEGLPDAGVLPVGRRGNLLGAIDMGMAPDVLPGRVANDDAGRKALSEAWGTAVPGPGLDADGIIDALDAGSVRALLLLGADPAADHPDRSRAAAALGRAEFVVALDLFVTDSNRGADVILPVDGFSEVEGTVTNVEGRVQKVNRIAPGTGQSRPASEVIADLAEQVGGSIGGPAETLAKEIAAVAPAYADITWHGLDWGEGRDGVVVNGSEGLPPAPSGFDAPAEGFALHLGRVLYDTGTMVTSGPSLAKLTPSPAAHLHPDDAASLGVNEGDAVTIATGNGSVVLPVELDGSLASKTVYVPFNFGLGLGGSGDVTVTAGGHG